MNGKNTIHMVNFLSMLPELRWLEDLFATRSHVKVLRALVRLPRSKAASGREIARGAGVTHPTALKALDVLAERGVVTTSFAGRTFRYRLNYDHVAYPLVRSAFEWETGLSSRLLEFLRDALSSRIPGLRAAYVFGSVARGDATLRSDLDVAVLCEPDFTEAAEEALIDLQPDVQSRFGWRLSPMVRSQSIRWLRSFGPSVWKHILAEGVPIIEDGAA